MISEKLYNTIPDTKDASDKAVLVSAKKDISMIQEDAEVTPCVKHVLSKEMQLFYDTIINCINSTKDDERQCAFESLRSDAGLQQLLPYLIQYATENISRNLRNISVLFCMLELCNCLLLNVHLFVEPYLHQMMPMLLSCILAKCIGTTTSSSALTSPSLLEATSAKTFNHWMIREKACQVVSFVCKKFGNSYQTLFLRIAKTLTKSIHDTSKPVCCHYGAFYGLSLMGVDTIELMVLPLLKDYVTGLNYESRFDLNCVQRKELEMVYQLLITISKHYLQARGETSELLVKFEQIFGDDFLLMDVETMQQ